MGEELYASEILEFGLKKIDYFAGVYALDQLPVRETLLLAPFTLVVNVQPANLPGLPWIAVWVNAQSEGEIFDPLGLVAPDEVRQWLRKQQGMCGDVARSYIMVQHPQSSVWRHLALHYCAQRPLCTSLAAFFSHFLSSSLARNYTATHKYVYPL